MAPFSLTYMSEVKFNAIKIIIKYSHYLLMFCMKNRQFENMSKIATTKLFSVLRKCSLETDVCDRFNIYGGSVR